MRKNYHTDNKSFMIYKDWEEYLGALTDEEKGKLFGALFAYAKRGEEAQFDGVLQMLFTMMKNTLDRDGKKWENVCKARKESSCTKAATKNTTGVTKAAKNYDTDKDKEKDKDIVTETEKEPRGAGRSACGGFRSAKKSKKISDENEHSYDLDKLVEYAMNNTPKLKKPDGDGS